MNIFLEAFVDTNFGDNLFVHTVVSRYPEHTFHMLPKAGYEASYQILTNQETNIKLIPKDAKDSFLADIDVMMVVGGDMFWEGTYSDWIHKVKLLKKRNKPVIFIGMSLFPQYSWKTRHYLKKLLQQVDEIVVREHQSYEQLKQIAPKANVISGTDIAFTTDLTAFRSIPVDEGVLGISVRKKIPREGVDAYEQYCDCMADTVITYLAANDFHRVKFLGLSTGVFDDEAVAREIAAKCPGKYHSRIAYSNFSGNVEDYIREIATCETLLCTRFHALVYGILLQKPFIPIVYEEKTKRLLSEIGYKGMSFQYEEPWTSQTILESFATCETQKEHLCKYLEKANRVFQLSDTLLGK